MAAERLKPDANFKVVNGGVTDDANLYPTMFRVDPVTLRLKVDAAITSGAGGTQYTEADTDASITGTAIMWEDGSDTLRAVSAAKPLPVSVATIPSHAVTNAGTFATQATLQAGTAKIGAVLPPDIDVTAHTNYARKYYTAATPTDGIIWSPAAGKRWHVVTMYINVSAASTITLEDDKAGGDDPVWKGEIAANSGVVLSFTEHYPMASGEDAADLIITATAGTVYVSVVGYEI